MRGLIRIGTRPSLLALRQVEEIKGYLPETHFKIASIKTTGDKDKITPLDQQEGSAFFTDEIEKALLEGKIDAAVHSAKDMEESLPEQLVIAAVTCSISPFECLVSRGNLRLNQLSRGAVIGTSSSKRKAAIIRFRGDLIIKDIRGNVDERIRRLDRADFDAIIVAHAALIRLGYQDRIAEIIPPNVIEPHPLQGRLAIQVRRDKTDIIELFRSIDAG